MVKEVNWLGDLVMSLPALRAIRRTYSDSTLAVLVKAELAGFFAGLRWVDEVIPYSVRQGMPGIRDRARIVASLRKRGFDLAVLFPNSFESALWVWLAGIPRRAGFIADGRGPMLTDKAAVTPAAMDAHQGNYWLEMVRGTLAADGDPADAGLEPDHSTRARMQLWLTERRHNPSHGKLIAIAPSAAYGPAKEWPLASFASLIDSLASQTDAECVVVGSPGEQAKCEQVAASSRSGAIVAAGATDVAELIALLSLCDGFVGNDSGSAHLAAALGIPAIAIFGSTNPARTSPLGPRARVIYRSLECSPCLDRTCRFGHYNCLTQISPEEVADALAQML